MKPMKATFIIAPWVALVTIASYGIWNYARNHRRIEQVKDILPPEAHKAVDDLEVYGPYGPFQACAWTSISPRERCFQVVVNDRVHIYLVAKAEQKGSLFVSVSPTLRVGDGLVECGNVEGKPFPSFLVVYPQRGRDAGRFAYGDYDLDGEFEKRMELLGSKHDAKDAKR